MAFTYKTIDFGNQYISSYPSFFLFTGFLMEVADISFNNMVRFYPLLSMVLFGGGIILLSNSISKSFGIVEEKKRLSIISLTFVCFAVLLLSFGVRTDPSPQALALMLVPYVLAVSPATDTKNVFIWLVLLLALVTTHMLTTFVAAVLQFWFLMFTGKFELRTVWRVVLHIMLWLFWIIYLGAYQMQWGANYILGAFKMEFDFTKGTQGLSMPGLEQYADLRLLGLGLTGLLMVIGMLYLLTKQHRLAFLLGGLIACAAIVPLGFFFIPGMQFLTRVFEFPVVFMSLAFGFGIHATITSGRSGEGIRSQIYKSLPVKFATVSVITITFITASYLTVLTTRQSDVKMRPTDSYVLGYQFMLSKSDDSILSPYPFPVQNSEEKVWHYRHVWAYDENMSEKDKAERMFKSFTGMIGLSDQWRIKQQYVQMQEATYLVELEEWLAQLPQVQFIYDNGNFKTYRKVLLPEAETAGTEG
jgi:hypothetical protein